MNIIGISSYYHDSAATLLVDGIVVAAAQEERFTRIKQDSSFPLNAIQSILDTGNISNISEIDIFVFYDKPILKFERLLETYFTEAPNGFKSFLKSMPLWIKDKLFLKDTLIKELLEIQMLRSNKHFTRKEKRLVKENIASKIRFSEHHLSHAGSAFYPSPFNEAAVLTIDGVGEWTTTSIAYGKESSLEILEELHFPHSLGLLYSAFTYYSGFKVNSGEYKLMGLAPYGEPVYASKIKEFLVDIKNDGSFHLDMSYFNYSVGLTMTNEKFHNLFGGEPRTPESVITQREMDLAASIQEVTNDIVIGLAKRAKEITGSSNLCLAGGVALNCVSNGKLLEEGIFDDIWIQPAAGDSGGSLGASFVAYYEDIKIKTKKNTDEDGMNGSYLGPSYTKEESISFLDSVGATYTILDEETLLDTVSSLLSMENVIGWHQGRMEFGPRSLGNRSILGDPRSEKMQEIMNIKIKKRESFRPFAPSVLEDHCNEWFELTDKSPYMLFVKSVQKNKRLAKESVIRKGLDKIKNKRSIIPAVTHVDYSARIQTVNKNTNPRYYKLIEKFNKKTGCPILINTSFNVRGEPIVCTPKDSFNCFMNTNMDVLVIDNILLYKRDQIFCTIDKEEDIFLLD